MALSKQTVREALLRFCGMWNVAVTTSAGAGDGTTFISTDYAGYGEDLHEAMWAMPRTGTWAGVYRQIDSFTPSTFTMVRAFGAGAVASGITVEIMPVRPDYITEALNRAIVEAWPYLYLGALDSSITLTANDLTYTLPAGVTPKMIMRVATEGEDNTAWDDRPRYIRDDWECSPDGATLWLAANPTSRYRNVETGRKLYLFLQKYLTAFDQDTTFGSVATDTTAKIELTQNTEEFNLYLKFARACLYETLAAAPTTAQRGEYLTLAQQFRQIAERDAPSQRMRSLDYPLSGG